MPNTFSRALGQPGCFYIVFRAVCPSEDLCHFAFHRHLCKDSRQAYLLFFWACMLQDIFSFSRAHLFPGLVCCNPKNLLLEHVMNLI